MTKIILEEIKEIFEIINVLPIKNGEIKKKVKGNELDLITSLNQLTDEVIKELILDKNITKEKLFPYIKEQVKNLENLKKIEKEFDQKLKDPKKNVYSFDESRAIRESIKSLEKELNNYDLYARLHFENGYNFYKLIFFLNQISKAVERESSEKCQGRISILVEKDEIQLNKFDCKRISIVNISLKPLIKKNNVLIWKTFDYQLYTNKIFTKILKMNLGDDYNLTILFLKNKIRIIAKGIKNKKAIINSSFFCDTLPSENREILSKESSKGLRFIDFTNNLELFPKQMAEILYEHRLSLKEGIVTFKVKNNILEVSINIDSTKPEEKTIIVNPNGIRNNSTTSSFIPYLTVLKDSIIEATKSKGKIKVKHSIFSKIKLHLKTDHPIWFEIDDLELSENISGTLDYWIAPRVSEAEWDEDEGEVFLINFINNFRDEK